MSKKQTVISCHMDQLASKEITEISERIPGLKNSDLIRLAIHIMAEQPDKVLDDWFRDRNLALVELKSGLFHEEPSPVTREKPRLGKPVNRGTRRVGSMPV